MRVIRVFRGLHLEAITTITNIFRIVQLAQWLDRRQTCREGGVKGLFPPSPQFLQGRGIQSTRYSGYIEGRLFTLDPPFPSTALLMYDCFEKLYDGF